MKLAEAQDDSLLVDISDALSERDRVRFTVHTRTKLPQFAKQNLSVVRQHEEFIWLHDCLEDNDLYAGYIIPPAPPRPDFEASREKLQRLGDSQASLMKEEFAKMKQELEVEYLSIFKKTVAMHEIFLQRLAAHHKFREDNNFKIFLEYENELAVRCKSKKERLAGSISSLGKSLTDFVITTSQVASNSTAAGSALLAGSSPRKQSSRHSAIGSHQTSTTSDQLSKGNTLTSDNNNKLENQQEQQQYSSSTTQNKSVSQTIEQEESTTTTTTITSSITNGNNNNNNSPSEGNPSSLDEDDIDEQYFEKERLFLALYHNSIKETASQADKVVQLQKCVANDYLYIAQQLIKLASVEIVPITTQTKDTSSFIACQLPSLTMPALSASSSSTSKSFSPHQPSNSQLSVYQSSTSQHRSQDLNDDFDYHHHHQHDEERANRVDFSLPSSSKSAIHSPYSVDNNNTTTTNTTSERLHADSDVGASNSNSERAHQQSTVASETTTLGCTSQGLKQMLLNVSDFFEQARKIETRIASDEDLKLTDLFLYYKRDTVAAQDLLMRRLRFMSDYETAVRNLDKARLKGRTQMQLAEVIQEHAKKNYVTISKLAKEELINYKQRRVTSFRKTFSDLVELELKHLKSYSQLISNCLSTCRGLSTPTTSVR